MFKQYKDDLLVGLLAVAFFVAIFTIVSVLSAPARGAEVETPAAQYLTGDVLLKTCQDHNPSCPAYVAGTLDAVGLAVNCRSLASKDDLMQEMQALSTILSNEKPEVLSTKNAAEYVLLAFTYTSASKRCPSPDKSI